MVEFKNEFAMFYCIIGMFGLYVAFKREKERMQK